ncbi:MAG: hypothetical protein KGQ36_00505 [Rickettsiales bacterium]|nr:hypothetical protein [Rickettsiales bacterium]
MLQIKSKSITKYFLLPLLLALFISSKAVLFAHSLSHQFQHSNNFVTAENSILEKIISSHFANFVDASKKAENCSLCELWNLQNQILPVALAVFTILAFYLAFISREFNKVKLSYLLSSYYSRAPPAIS